MKFKINKLSYLTSLSFDQFNDLAKILSIDAKIFLDIDSQFRNLYFKDVSIGLLCPSEIEHHVLHGQSIFSIPFYRVLKTIFRLLVNRSQCDCDFSAEPDIVHFQTSSHAHLSNITKKLSGCVGSAKIFVVDVESKRIRIDFFCSGGLLTLIRSFWAFFNSSLRTLPLCCKYFNIRSVIVFQFELFLSFVYYYSSLRYLSASSSVKLITCDFDRNPLVAPLLAAARTLSIPSLSFQHTHHFPFPYYNAHYAPIVANQIVAHCTEGYLYFLSQSIPPESILICSDLLQSTISILRDSSFPAKIIPDHSFPSKYVTYAPTNMNHHNDNFCQLRLFCDCFVASGHSNHNFAVKLHPSSSLDISWFARAYPNIHFFDNKECIKSVLLSSKLIISNGSFVLIDALLNSVPSAVFFNKYELQKSVCSRDAMYYALAIVHYFKLPVLADCRSLDEWDSNQHCTTVSMPLVDAMPSYPLRDIIEVFTNKDK